MRLATLFLPCALAMTAPAHAQHAHDTHAAHAATTATALPAQRWTPDAPLREGMRRAYAAVDQLRHRGHTSAPMAADRAASVEAAVTYMFAHCKLSARPDAALHGILVPLMTAAQALKNDPQNLAAITHMRAAIARYPLYFDDPGCAGARARAARRALSAC